MSQPMSRLRCLLAAVGAVIVGATAGGCGAPDRPLASGGPRPGARPERPAPATVSRPNFLVIVTDDQRWDELTPTFMPRTWERVVQQGVRFTRAYVTTSLCCPSRASILTGLYARHHGVRKNITPLAARTFAAVLHAAGYHTGMVGKYLNSWDGDPRPEYDFWVSFRRGDIDYSDPNLNVNGTWGVRPGYSTHLLRNYALRFLRQAPADRPFLLYFAVMCPHVSMFPAGPAIPAPEDAGLYADLPPYRRPNFNEADVSDKPAWIQALPRLTPENVQDVNYRRRQRLRSLMAADRAVDSLLALLQRQGRLDNTFVLFMSDNGFFEGEHRLAEAVPGSTLGNGGKDRAYEEGHLVPFAVRYPPLVATPRTDAHLVANIDVAPTLYELAGVAPPYAPDGRSLVPLLRQTATSWRDALLLESSLETLPSARYYSAVRTARYHYIETVDDSPELYDTRSDVDPYELRNAVRRPEYATVVARLRRRLHGAW